MSEDLGQPQNALTEMLGARGGGVVLGPPPPKGSSEGPPAVHIGGSGRMTHDAQADAHRAAARPSVPPPPEFTLAHTQHLTSGNVYIQSIDLKNALLITSHGTIPISPECMDQIVEIALERLEKFFEESIAATREAYGLDQRGIAWNPYMSAAGAPRVVGSPSVTENIKSVKRAGLQKKLAKKKGVKQLKPEK